MITVREYIHEPNTNNKVDNRTAFQDEEAATLFYNKLVSFYDSSEQWSLKSDSEGVRTYTSNVDANICELSK